MRRFNLMAVMLLMALCFQSSPAWSLDRFVDLNDGTIVDTISSLRWLKNANCYGLQNWYTAMSSAANLASSSCGLTDGSIAGDWHLPTIDELRIFTDAGYRYDSLNAYGFTNVQGNDYWSSTTDAGDTNGAWFVSMSVGIVYGSSKYYLYNVWPVRGGQYWSLDSLVILGAVDFGSLPIGSVSPGHQFTLKNSGTTTLSVTSMALGGTDSTQFTLATGGSSPCSNLTPTLAAGASCTVMVSAKTTTIGSKSANLTVTTTAGSANIPLTATILPLAVTYNGNGNSSGSVPSDTTAYALNATATVLDNSGALAKTGYVFNGWNMTADGSGTSYQPGATFVITTPVTLYAIWAAIIAPPSGLVSWWRGEGGGIDTAGGLNGTPSAGMAYAAGKVGQAFSLNGSTASIAVPDNAKLNFGTNEFSLATWIKTTDTRIWQRLVTKRASTGYWYSLVLNSGKVTFEIAGGANITSTVSVANGMWHHIAVTRDPATVSPRKYHLYIDGVENVTLADNGLNLDNTAPLEVGKWSTEFYSGIYSGLIDEIQLFNRGLTAAEVQNIYNAGSAGLALVPTVSAISPSSGPATGGSQVVITGANLASATVVKFGNNAAGFTVNSDTQITAVTPFSSSGTVDITVTTLGGTSAISSADQFTYAMVDQTITFGTAPTIAVGGNGVVSATASSGLAVTFSSQTPSVCSISGATVTGAAQGACIIKASQAGNATYNPAEQTQSFTITAAVAPTAVTLAATAITISGATLNATLNATVNANYSSALVSFEYGATTAYGSTTTASPSSVSGGTPTSSTAVINGLAPGSTYHFRVKAVNAVTGTVYGNDATFTTPLPRFVDLNDGTMLDTNNSLRWLQNANCTDTAGGIAKADGYLVWDDAQTWSRSLASPACALGDGSKAGDWHLPTIDELQTLVVAPDNYRYDTLNAAGFTHVQASFYWSSSTYADLKDYAWGVSMIYGDVHYDIKIYAYPNYVWPVRAGQYWSLGSLVVLGTVDFGSQSIGSASSGHQFTLKNTAATAQPVSGIALNGTDANQFSVTTGGSSPCVSLTPTLAAGASCTVVVSAAPTSSGAKTANLTVTTAAGSTAIPLTVTAIYPVPIVTGISPSSGFAAGGTSVTISGTGFNGATAVKFAATDAASFSVASETQLTATSPVGVIGQIADVAVTTQGGTSVTSSADEFSYILQYQAKNQSTGSSYTTLAEAITGAGPGNEIRAYAGQLDGAFSLVRDISLNGGYNVDFNAKDSLPTTLNGSLSVDGGAAKVDGVTFKGLLTIKNGSLQVSGVVVK